MGNNKFNDFYSKKNTSELINLLRRHVATINQIDLEWFNALKKHLNERTLTDDEKKTIYYILTANPDDLKEIIYLEEKKKNEIQSISTSTTVDKNNIIAAGKAIKGVVYAAILLILDIIIGAIVISNLEDIGSVKSAYVYVGGIGVICNFFVLERLYACGNNLENSVIKK